MNSSLKTPSVVSVRSVVYFTPLRTFPKGQVRSLRLTENAGTIET